MNPGMQPLINPLTAAAAAAAAAGATSSGTAAPATINAMVRMHSLHLVLLFYTTVSKQLTIILRG